MLVLYAAGWNDSLFTRLESLESQRGFSRRVKCLDVWIRSEEICSLRACM